MGYGQAIEEAWSSIERLAGKGRFEIKLLSDIYKVDTGTRSVVVGSDNISAKEYTSIIILHYLAKSISPGKLPEPTGEWIDFNQIPGAESYYPTYRKRTIDRLIKRYGEGKEDIKKIVPVFDGVEFMLKVTPADEEFGADAAILYDRSITNIFCIEDVVVLTEIVVHSL